MPAAQCRFADRIGKTKHDARWLGWIAEVTLLPSGRFGLFQYLAQCPQCVMRA
jgi:hypothetical protein